MKKVVWFKKLNHQSEDIQRGVRNILYQLERYGRALTTNAKAARYVARNFNKVRHTHVYWGWDKRRKTSIIALSPSVRVRIIAPYKIRIEVKKH